MDIKAIIFDLDGVIVSTDEFHYKAWKQLADQENIYFDKEINKRLRGVSRMESLSIVLERAGIEYSDNEKLELAARKNDIYVKLLSELNESYVSEDVKMALNNLKNSGCKLAIGSSSKNAKTILKAIGLLDFFDVIADGTDIKKSKPDPEVFLLAASRLNIPPVNCAVVEDAHAGIDAAKAADMCAVAINDAYGYENADFSIRKMSDLADTYAEGH